MSDLLLQKGVCLIPEKVINYLCIKLIIEDMNLVQNISEG